MVPSPAQEERGKGGERVKEGNRRHAVFKDFTRKKDQLI